MVSSAVDKMFRSLCHNLQRMFLFSFPWPSIIVLLYSFSIRHCKEIIHVVDLSLPVTNRTNLWQNPGTSDTGASSRWMLCTLECSREGS